VMHAIELSAPRSPRSSSQKRPHEPRQTQSLKPPLGPSFAWWSRRSDVLVLASGRPRRPSAGRRSKGGSCRPRARQRGRS
jgi:hypothetical protein